MASFESVADWEMHLALNEDDEGSNPSGLTMKRYRNDVGKDIGGRTYVHQTYESTIPNIEWAKSKIGDFQYEVVIHDRKSGAISFSQSPDFDTSPEPIKGYSLTVFPDGKVRPRLKRRDPEIYHHKWLMVRDDYPGFDVQESKDRSDWWTSLEGIDRSRIGRKSFWDASLAQLVRATDS